MVNIYEADNSEIVQKDISLINQNMSNQKHSDLNEDIGDKKNNIQKNISPIPLEVKKNKRKNKDKKDVENIEIIDEEAEDVEMFSFYEG